MTFYAMENSPVTMQTVRVALSSRVEKHRWNIRQNLFLFGLRADKKKIKAKLFNSKTMNLHTE